ncbi:hypothetical protein phi18_202 [Bacillus phage phi18]|nr:hypothetical protein phi18_005 [Bacillus phage phi18]UAV84472.1 hypothetical protein phi18_202 [Bacillus phage phi18]
MTKWSQQYKEQGGAYMSDTIITVLASATTAIIVATLLTIWDKRRK